MGHVTMFKPAKGTAKILAHERKAKRRALKAKLSQREKLERWQQMKALRELIYERDKGACRVCAKALMLDDGTPRTIMQMHHIVYRSQGGSLTEPSNLISLCFDCHRDEHEARIELSGDGNGIVQLVIYDKHHNIAAVEERPCPSR